MFSLQRDKGAALQCDLTTYQRERPGMSAFIRENGIIYHTYSGRGRGMDAIWSMYPWLDRAPKGRNEAGGPWWRHRDGYAAPTPEMAMFTSSCCG